MLKYRSQRLEYRLVEKLAILTLTYPEKRNILSHDMLLDLLAVMAHVQAAISEKTCRALLWKAEGPSFCAGADRKGQAESIPLLSEFFRRYAQLPIPTCAIAQGVALGGGVGILACTDVVYSHQGAEFGFPECQLGLAPAIIAPYVVAALGKRRARGLFLTGERFTAEQALDWGLLYKILPQADDLSTVVCVWEEQLRGVAPSAWEACYTAVDNTPEQGAACLAALWNSRGSRSGD